MNDKRWVDIDDLMKFVIKQSPTSEFSDNVKSIFDEYTSEVIPDIKIGQAVWVITNNNVVMKCHVIKMTFKSRFSFTVKGDRCYHASFVASSIGKRVFFSEEEAVKILNK